MPEIGVRMPAAFEDAGEFLADARALEAAGAGLLLVGDGPLDHGLLVAALAAVTSTANLAAPAAEAAQLSTLRLLTRDRLAENLEGLDRGTVPGEQEGVAR
jgi:hypothetical protein